MINQLRLVNFFIKKLKPSRHDKIKLLHCRIKELVDKFKMTFEPFCDFMFVLKIRLNATQIFINLFDFSGFLICGKNMIFTSDEPPPIRISFVLACFFSWQLKLIITIIQLSFAKQLWGQLNSLSLVFLG